MLPTFKEVMLKSMQTDAKTAAHKYHAKEWETSVGENIYTRQGPQTMVSSKTNVQVSQGDNQRVAYRQNQRDSRTHRESCGVAQGKGLVRPLV